MNCIATLHYSSQKHSLASIPASTMNRKEEKKNPKWTLEDSPSFDSFNDCSSLVSTSFSYRETEEEKEENSDVTSGKEEDDSSSECLSFMEKKRKRIQSPEEKSEREAKKRMEEELLRGSLIFHTIDSHVLFDDSWDDSTSNLMVRKS
eukprot:TRINITY_DN1756_c0_g1_i1.p1 TRINITY_DN1756_c0_g1~~TRINITY_DN1756_c0_g1_i1.p1  ORF type:complete len:148 (-),score=60.09 TRINITY_DN1756_c0_g1_i1:145-588(-)